MSHLPAVGLGAIGWPEDDLADRVSEGVLPQAPVQVRGGEQLGVVLRRPGQQRRALTTEAASGVQGPVVVRAHAASVRAQVTGTRTIARTILAIVSAPFDEGVSSRPGARSGPGHPDGADCLAPDRAGPPREFPPGR